MKDGKINHYAEAHRGDGLWFIPPHVTLTETREQLAEAEKALAEARGERACMCETRAMAESDDIELRQKLAEAEVKIARLLRDINYLQSALIAAGHEPDCPIVHAAGVDCVSIGGCVDYRAKYEDVETLVKELELQAIVALSGSGVCTPVEGYRKNPGLLSSDIRVLRQQRDVLETEAVNLRQALQMALDYVTMRDFSTFQAKYDWPPTQTWKTADLRMAEILREALKDVKRK